MNAVILFIGILFITQCNLEEQIPATDNSANTNNSDIEELFVLESSTEVVNETVKTDNTVLISDISNNTSINNDSNTNETTSSNITEAVSDNANNSSLKSVKCKPSIGNEVMEIVNASRLLQILLPDGEVNPDMPGNCVVVVFYATSCPFSASAARYFNALPRVFPDIKMAAIDAMSHSIFNAQNGVVGVPTLMLFHNGRPVAKFNESEYRIDHFVKFLTKHTGLKSNDNLFVTSADFRGPLLSTPEFQRDYCLVLSWTFIVICAVYFFTRSRFWKWIVETVQNTWRESEAQREHID